MKNKNCFSLVELMIVIAIIALFAALMLPRVAQAQPYFTNATAASGPFQYNDALTPPAQPSQVIARQSLAGIQSGFVVTTADGTVTNTFSTNCIYTAPPIVVTRQRGKPTTTTSNIIVVTTSNFVINVGTPTSTNDFYAIGH